MNLTESEILNKINYGMAFIQSHTDKLTQKSFLLQHLDFFIFTALILTLTVSVFGSTNQIGAVSLFVPALVFIKLLVTKNEKITLEPWNFFLLVYLIICFITNFTSSLITASFYGFFKTFVYITFYFALCHFLKSNKKYIIPVLFIIAGLISIESIIGIFQNIIGVENISTWQDTSYVNPEDVLSRVYGTLKPYNPNLFGGYLLAGFSSFIAVLAVLINSKKIKSAIAAFILMLITMFTLFLSGCRGAYLGLFTIIAGVCIASYFITFKFLNKYQKQWKITAWTCAVSAVIFTLLNHGILQRIMSIFIMRGDSSTSFRFNVYNSAISMFHDNPIFGIGVGNKVFREIYGLYMLSGFDALSCYCVFLEMAVESGIFALIAYILFLIFLIKNAVKHFKSNPSILTKIIIFVSLISIIAVMVHGFVDTVYFRPQIQYLFWTLTAILTVLIREEKTEIQ